MAAAGNASSASMQMPSATASVAVQPLPLTEHNLKQLQPYIIRPMSPVTISSSHSPSNADDLYATDCGVSRNSADDPGNGDLKEVADGMESTAAAMAAAPAKEPEAEARRQRSEQAKMRAARDVARLRFWVYNAMQTLLGLGPEGVSIVEVDELYIAGPGDVRLKQWAPGEEGTSGGLGIGEHAAPCGDDTTARNGSAARDADAACRPKHEPLPNLADPRYWRDKLRHFTQLCTPLSQARRQERRLAAKNNAANHLPQEDLPEELQEDARMDAWRSEQSRQLYKDRHSRMVQWVMGLEAGPPTPVHDDEAEQAVALYREREILYTDEQNGEAAAGPAPPSSDSSVVEISPVQFVAATRDRDRLNTPQDSTAPTTTKGTRASTAAPTTAPTTATNCNSEPQLEAKRRKHTHTRSSTQSTNAPRTRAVQTPLASTSPEQPKKPFTDAAQATAEKPGGVKVEAHTSHNRAGVLGKRQRDASVDDEPHN